MKRLLLFVYLLAGLLLASNYNFTTEAKLNDYDLNVSNVQNLNFNDEKIGIIITKEQRVVTIEHTSGYTLTHAVVEYASMESGERVSRLDIFEVRNNKFTLNVDAFAVKVHQVKRLYNNVYYTYATTNKNTAGSFDNVTRKNIVEIETTAVLTAKSRINWRDWTEHHDIYEFYFDFKEDHDKVHSIDVNYNVKRRRTTGKYDNYKNISAQNLSTNDTWNLWKYRLSFGGVVRDGDDEEKVKVLEKNLTSNPGNYVARIAPTASNYDLYDTKGMWWTDTYLVENFAIIKIEYEIDGEFIISDVINDPTTPADEALNWLIAFVDALKKFSSSITNFFTGNASTILKVVVAIIILIVIKPAIALIKLFTSLIKLVINGIKTLFTTIINSLRWLFIPSKKKNKRRRN